MIQSPPKHPSRRFFVAAALGGVAASYYGAALLRSEPRARGQTPSAARALDVRTQGARGDGRTDDTAALAAALKTSDVVSVPAGTFLVSQIEVPAGKTILTEGMDTILRQRPGQPSATPVLRIIGSNVVIGGLRVVGNIDTDTGEWMHAIAIHPKQSTGSLSNIEIGDIIGENIRGDVVEIYPTAPYRASRIRLGHLVGNNVLRSVVSIGGGDDIEIRSCTGWRVGYSHLTVEPDVSCTPATNVRVGHVKGRNAIVAPVSPSVLADEVAIGTLELDPSFALGSMPQYPPGTVIANTGLHLRNCKSLKISQFRANGFGGPAIRQIYGLGELSRQELRLDQAEITGCGRAGRDDEASILGAPDVTHLTIGRLAITLDSPGANGIQSCHGAVIGEVDAVLGPGTRLFRDIQDGMIGPVYARSGAGTLIISGERTEFRGGDVAVDVLGAYSTRLRFRDAVLKGEFVGPNCDSHAFENATLNDHFYGSADGVGC